MPKPNKTTATTDRPENGPNIIEVALTQLFSDADQGRRTRLIAALKPFTAVFAEAGFTAGGGWRATAIGAYNATPKATTQVAPVSKMNRAAHMAHVLDEARNTPFMDRYSAKTPTVEYVGLYTKSDDGLSVKIGRNLLREGVFVRMDALEPIGRMRPNQAAETNFFEAVLPNIGQRTIQSSQTQCQRNGVASSEIVSLIGTFLAAVKSPAAGLYNDAIKTLADRAKAEEEEKQARLQAQADEERRRLYGSSFYSPSFFGRR